MYLCKNNKKWYLDWLFKNNFENIASAAKGLFDLRVRHFWFNALNILLIQCMGIFSKDFLINLLVISATSMVLLIFSPHNFSKYTSYWNQFCFIWNLDVESLIKYILLQIHKLFFPQNQSTVCTKHSHP